MSTVQSILIASKDKEESRKRVVSIIDSKKIDSLDTDILSFEKIVGIEDIRTMQKRLFLKPIKSDFKAVIIEAYEGITVEAQNSLLKILEEPPANTILILTALNKDLLLPTILSRCKIIEFKEKLHEISEKEISQDFNTLISLKKGGVGNRLKLAQDFSKSKEETVIWLEQMLLVVRKKLVNLINDNTEVGQNFSVSEYLDILKRLQETYTVIKATNVNQRFALENLFLNL